MTGAERGFLRLCSSLGRQDRPILTLRQFRLLGRRALMEDQPNLSGEVTEELLSLIDVLVDGRFEEEKKNISLRFRGSENQRLIDMKRTRAEGRVVLWQE